LQKIQDKFKLVLLSIMKSMDILEIRIKEVISREKKIAEEHRKLLEEVKILRESIEDLEKDRQEANSRLDKVIEKVELYISRSEA
jgi:phosphoenolpyruvate-protein kinase (PTS system EI component)